MNDIDELKRIEKLKMQEERQSAGFFRSKGKVVVPLLIISGVLFWVVTERNMWNPWLIYLGFLLTLIVGFVIGRYPNWGTYRELVLITRHYKDGSSSEYIIMEGHISRFVKASLQLHYKPGINPYNGKELKKIAKMTLREQVGLKTSAKLLEGEGSYWWSTPGLKRSFNSRGARMFSKWDTPGLVCEWAKEETIIRDLQPA